MTFEDYCSELGLSEDSRQAKQTYDAIRAMAPRLECASSATSWPRS